jgi:DNA invertase Pin-like site-specific DNA recombinase
MGRLIGYARTSTPDQVLDLQLDALRAAGAAEIHTDQISGARPDRHGLAAALAACQPGDTLAVWKLDRLGRSVGHLAAAVQELAARGVAFRSLTEAIDTGTTGGRLLLHVLAAVAEAERDMAQDRIRAGMASAKARGRRDLGRPPALSPDQIVLARRLRNEGQSLRQIARTIRGRGGAHPSPSTVRACLDAIPTA